MRLDAFLASALNESRSIVKKYIKQKRVLIGEKKALSPAENIDGKEVFLDGKKIEKRGYIYLLLNKPAGYVSTTEAIPESVLSLIPENLKTKKLAPAGRLDKESEGLLILTDDGDFAHEIISPSKHLEKTYFVVASHDFSEEDVKTFSEGMTLKDGTCCKPAKLQLTEKRNEAYVILTEGKYHQVRRMTAAVGNHVERLVRLRIGPYSIDGIAEGKVKEIEYKKG